MKKISVRILLFICIPTLLTWSCKKDEKKDTDTTSAQDDAFAEVTFSDLNNISVQAVQDTALRTYRTNGHSNFDASSCATLSITPDGSGGGNIVVDFGTTACQCLDTRFRHGKVLVHFTGAYRDSGTIITTTLQDYYVGSSASQLYKVTGTKTTVNKGHNSAGHLWYTIDVNGIIVNPTGLQMTWISSRQREWVAGESTMGWYQWGDDNYLITGTASGTSFNGTAFTAVIQTPLDVLLGCRWIRAGKFQFTSTGNPAIQIDYGNGGCDAAATAIVNNISYPFTLR